MIKNILKSILFRGPTRRLLSNRPLQPVWESLHKLSLYGMNYGGGNSIEQSGELWSLEWLRRRHAAARPGSPAVIFDVGAHGGTYSLRAARIFGDDARVYGFEPAAAVYKSLRAATADRPNIMVFNCGLGEHEGTVPLYYDTLYSQMASVHATAHAIASDPPPGRLMEEIRLRTVDAFCDEQAIPRIDLLKIDVEGNELNVLRGATRMIGAGAVGAIQFEFGAAQVGSRTFFKDIHRLLSPRYRIHRILASGLSRNLDPYDVTLEVYRTTNYLAVLRDDPAR